jgi:PAS domain S-box-containing protein
MSSDRKNDVEDERGGPLSGGSDAPNSRFEIINVHQDAFFRDLVEHSPDLVLCTDPCGKVLYANASALLVLGYSADEIIEQSVAVWLAADPQEDFDDLAATLVGGATVGPLDLSLTDAGGEQLTLEAKINCRFEHGEPAWFRFVLRDLRSELTDEVEARLVDEPSEPGEPKEEDQSPSILVVEDDDICARMLARLLERGGYRTERAATGTEALEKLANHSFDAMTLDLALPDKDGVELLHQIRTSEENRDLPVIVVSASADETRQSLTGDAANVADWLNKPFAYDSLRSALKRAVDVGEDRLPRVLHVEDDDIFCAQVRQTLADVAVTERAATLAEARRKLKDDEDYDLVLLDLTLPDGLGAELLPFLNRPRGKSVPVILVSSSETTDALAAHVADTLIKSHTDQQQMLDTIRAHLRR